MKSAEQRLLECIDPLCAHIERFGKYVERSKNDIAGIVLHGHLLIEEVLTGILTDRLGIDELPLANKGGLAFHQKLHLVKKITLSYRFPLDTGLFEVIDRLNTMRNHLSHKIHEELEMAKEVQYVLQPIQKNQAKNGSSAPSAGSEKAMIAALKKVYYFLLKLRTHLAGPDA
jgi:hypothetical protein